MDLIQRKLTKSEWEGIEVPVSEDEREILKLIKNGYRDINIRYNNNEQQFFNKRNIYKGYQNIRYNISRYILPIFWYYFSLNY